MLRYSKWRREYLYGYKEWLVYSVQLQTIQTLHSASRKVLSAQRAAVEREKERERERERESSASHIAARHTCLHTHTLGRGYMGAFRLILARSRYSRALTHTIHSHTYNIDVYFSQQFWEDPAPHQRRPHPSRHALPPPCEPSALPQPPPQRPRHPASE